ncbi:MAG TPA: GNAT family N-acetyltransferase [Actinocrinis sp.]|jgi:ribosomal protein S18 acetylase RimI-like enzyme|uniref:GNAT family N-acetyltransferase n=1 Tax=Actinocrinis sp. TaxID=1920516 RepID=UPI002DDD8B4A|nr:GNAT family N-acetyltransferase [Actinocrinis sp.]HEV3170775.1 GNAT family N-acetyltransferase [Actinocrinis sp.]
MGKFEVRRVRADEWRQVRDIRLEALKDTPHGFREYYEDALAKPDEVWRERTYTNADSETSALFVAVARGGRLVGTTGVYAPDVSGREYVVFNVYVTAEFRGRELGVAGRLFDTAISWARLTGGAEVISLEVHSANDRARAFYRRYGFAETGVTKPAVLHKPGSIVVMRHDRTL